MKKLITILAVVLCATGCVTNKPDMTDVFPKGLEPLCIQQLQLAKSGIESCGTLLVKAKGVKVYLRKGEQKINGMWCWQMSEGYWIGGITEWSNRITVGCNPQTLGEVSAGVLLHEFGHYWLITNKGIHHHDKKYDPIFHWSQLGVNGKPKQISIRELVNGDKPENLPKGEF